MKKLMFVAVAALSTAAFAHPDIAKEAEGFYDVTFTTKTLEHSSKTMKKTFTKTGENAAYQAQLAASAWIGEGALKYGSYFQDSKITVTLDTGTKAKVEASYTYYLQKLVKKGNTITTNMVSKIVSKSSKGLYDAETGKVYLWDTAADSKVSVTNGQSKFVIDDDKRKRATKGYVAYEVPVAFDFIGADDSKAAGGFIGKKSYTKDTELDVIDFTGMTAYGSGTLKDDVVKTISGNIARKTADKTDFGCYGTWKLNKDSKSYDGLSAALLKKGCVELIEEDKDRNALWGIR